MVSTEVRGGRASKPHVESGILHARGIAGRRGGLIAHPATMTHASMDADAPRRRASAIRSCGCRWGSSRRKVSYATSRALDAVACAHVLRQQRAGRMSAQVVCSGERRARLLAWAAKSASARLTVCGVIDRSVRVRGGWLSRRACSISARTGGGRTRPHPADVRRRRGRRSIRSAERRWRRLSSSTPPRPTRASCCDGVVARVHAVLTKLPLSAAR